MAYLSLSFRCLFFLVSVLYSYITHGTPLLMFSLVIKHFTMDYHEFSIYYGILFYNFP